MTTCSTHVLDAALGVPAAGLDVALTSADGAIAVSARTDGDGRIRWADALTAAGLPEEVPTGIYRVSFATGAWFAAAKRATFFPAVDLTVEIAGPHVHVALLLSPFSYTTYKGS